MHYVRNKKNIFFRNDIQGLRGLAILSVAIFHFFPNLLPNGFLGVDLFFVISGYLITTIIIRDLNKNNFSFFNFYIKRFKRIYPSILLLLLTFSLILFFFLLPVDLKNFFNSVLSTLFFIPNIYFWLNGGYFGSVSELKPMLHMWSLGVEIQFYIFFPIFLILLFKYFKKNIIFLFILCIIFSYLLNLYLINIDGANLAFFMLPNRIWEFLIGGLVAIIPTSRLNSLLHLIIYYFFLITLFFLIILDFNIDLIFRSTLLILSFFFLIYFGKVNQSSYYSLLGNKIFVFFGKISYSFYLWHWPILVLAKYYFVRPLNFYESCFFLFISFSISYLNWYLIENHFRFKSSFNFLIRYSLGIIFLIIFIFLINNFNNSFPQRFTKEILNISNSIGTNYRCEKKAYIIFGASRACLIFNERYKNNDVPTIALLGNSHAQMYGYAFEHVVNRLPINGIIIPLNNCLPTTTYNISKDCMLKAKENLSSIIKNDKIKVVIIALTWDHKYLMDKFYNIKEENMDILLASSLYDLVLDLKKNNKKSIIIGPLSSPGYNFSSEASRNIYFKKNENFNNFNNFYDYKLKYNNTFMYLDSKEDLTLIKPHEIQCKNNLQCNFLIDGKSIFSDDNHLGKYGSLIFEDLLLDNLLKKMN
jgi:peptidoglycan/LPS O-acetylase OafA/YrhL